MTVDKRKSMHGIYRMMTAGLAVMLIFVFYHRAWAEEPELRKMESGKVVFSWEEFKGLLEELDGLKKAVEKAKEKDEKEIDRPPVDYSIEKAEYTCLVEGETARFEASFSVSVLKDGWSLAPFLSKEAAIESVNIEPADLPGKTGSLDTVGLLTDSHRAQPPAQLVRNKTGYALLAKGPGVFNIQTVFYLPVRLENLVRTLTFKAPPSVVNRAGVRIPEKGVNLIEAAPPGKTLSDDRGVTFQTVLSDRDQLRLSWRIEKESGIVRKKHAIVHALASVEKSAVIVLCKIKLKHMDSLERTEFRLPLDVEIINVTGPAIDRWEVEQTETHQAIKITGQADRHADVDISVSYRLRMAALPYEGVVPVVEVLHMDSLEGYLGVEIIGNLEVRSEGVENGIPIPAKNLPKSLWNEAANPLQYGYEYHLNGFSPILNIKSYQEIQTVVANVDLVDCLTHRTLAGKSVTRIQYFIRNNDRQFLTLTLPDKSRIWQVFLEGKPVKPAQKETGEILIPMMKSVAQGEELRSFVIEIAYISDVDKLSLKGDIINRLPGIDVPINYLRWRIYLPEYYGYTKFEGPLKQVEAFSNNQPDSRLTKPSIDIPAQGERFLFEKYLIVDETPYIKGKYGQYLGNDIFLALPGRPGSGAVYREKTGEKPRQVVPNVY